MAPALAVAPPPPNVALADFDTRAGDVASVPASSRRARKALEAGLGSEGFVETDRLTGGVYRAGRSDGFLTGASKVDPAVIVLDYLRSRPAAFGLDGEDVDRLSLDYRYASFDGVTHLYFVQASRGVPSYDTGVDAHVTKDGRIVSISARAVPGFAVAARSPAISAGEALAAAKRNVRGELRVPRARTRPNAERETSFSNGDRASLVVFAASDGERLAWKLIASGANGILYELVVDARSGSVLVRRSLTDFLANASVYDNYPGAPGGGSAVTFDMQAPESGAWINLAGSPRTKLDGNNAHGYADVNDNDVADAAEEVPTNDSTNWVYPRTAFTKAGCPPAGCAWNSTNSATKATNKKQVTTEVFYLNNRFHDWLLAPPVGFDEASRNFEHVNSSGQGSGNDRVQAEANDGGGENNANFATPPDGVAPRMQMYFTSVSGQSMNTGDDASVVFHEYTHGLTNRLVGNGSGLTALQSGAMGEGWSDWYALDYLVANNFETDTSAPAELKTGRHSFPPDGVRTEGTDCPVGAPAASCPGTGAAGSGGYTFGDLGKLGSPFHGNGEIWAQTLWDLRDALGSNVARGLVTGGLRLSPNAPSYLTMRDSILQANETTYGGAHYDTIWQVFAARGMGFNASTPGADSETGNEDFSLPPILAAQATTLDDAAPLGDGDGVVEPGETIKLTQALENPRAVAVDNVDGTLSTTTPGVTIGQATASWGTIAGGDSATNSTAFAFTVPSSHPCGAPIQLSLAITTSRGDLTVPTTVPTGVPGVITNDTPLPIPDNSATGVNSTVNVPAGAPITDLDVHIKNLTHPWVGDLRMTLRHPDGTVVTLMFSPGEGAFGSSASDFVDLVLDDDAANPIESIGNTGPISGSWRPNQALTAFDTKPRQGTWTLNVSDTEAGFAGTLNEWGLDYGDGPQCNTSPPPEAGTAPASAITETGATLNGTIDPNGAATDYAFQYGTTASYGIQTATASAGSGTSPVPQPSPITGLQPSTQYHYRIVALRGGSVAATGADASFTTQSGGGGAPGGGGGTPGGGGGGGGGGDTGGGGAPGGGGGGNGGGGATASPLVTFSEVGSIVVGSSGAFRFAFLARPVGISGTATFATAKAVASAKKKRQLRLARKSFTVPPNGQVNLRPKLSRKNLAVLRKRKRLSTVVQIQLGASSFTRTLSLTAPKRKRG